MGERPHSDEAARGGAVGALGAGFETLLGWRYLLRAQRRPRVARVGLALLVVGAVTLWGSSALSRSATELARWWLGGEPLISASEAFYALHHQITQLAQGAQLFGLVATVVGVCVGLFGVFYGFMTTFSAFSTFMIAMGVAEVILVLGVMNGFQGYLRGKLVDAHAHITIEPPEGELYLSGYQALAAEARGVEGVLGVSPTLSTEVMLRAPSEDISSAAKLLGVETASIDQTVALSRFISGGCGCLSALDDPAQVERALAEQPFPSVQAFCERECAPVSRAPAPDAPPDAPPDAASAPQPTGPMPLPPPAARRPRPAVLLGVHLRYSLNRTPGQRLDLISPIGDIGPNGPIPRVSPFTLAGWVSAGLAEVDSQQAYASLEAVQRFLAVGDVVSELRVRVPSIEGAREVRDRLQAHLGGRVRVRDWQERNQSLFNALQLERVAMFLVLTLNILLAAFSITSTLVMTLIERRREVAILMAMGARARSIVAIFVTQGLAAGVLGSLFGCLIGGGACAILAAAGLPLNAEAVYYISSIPVEVRALDVLAIVSVALSVSLLSTVYPAYYASRVRPVEGLRGR